MRTAPRFSLSVLALLSALVLMMAACEPQPEQPPADEPDTPDETTTVAATPPDTTGGAIWRHLRTANYQTWQKWPGKRALYPGNDPHGMLLTTYVNDAAYQAITNKAGTMPEGAIIVKENYMPDSTLAAVTVMYKAATGYNPTHNNWFFSKHMPDGSLDKTPTGAAMQGRVPGCQSCHRTKPNNDYLFTGSIQPAAQQ